MTTTPLHAAQRQPFPNPYDSESSQAPPSPLPGPSSSSGLLPQTGPYRDYHQLAAANSVPMCESVTLIVHYLMHSLLLAAQQQQPEVINLNDSPPPSPGHLARPLPSGSGSFLPPMMPEPYDHDHDYHQLCESITFLLYFI